MASSEEEVMPINASKAHSGGGGASPMLRTVAIVVTCLSVLCVLASVAFGGAILDRIAAAPSPETEAVAPLPARFAVAATARTPAKDQGHRGTCWAFATIGALEASYRKYGFEQGFLKENEFVAFSEQAYVLGVVKHCTENKTDRYCFGGPAHGDTADGRPEWFYYMRDSVTRYVLPQEVCGYKSQPEDQFDCPDLESAAENSPLSFRVTGIKSAYSVDSIKRLLYEKQAPLTWSHSVWDTTFTVPCDANDTALAESDECKQCLTPCAKSSTGCCAEMVFPGYMQDGVFGMYDKPKAAGGHAMLLLGWNDDMRVEFGLPGSRGQVAVGGFIIKNSWATSLGHSTGYWMQEHSKMDENFVCPTEGSARTWLPANRTCMLEDKDPVKCSSLYKNVLKEWIHGATVLQCHPRTHNNTARAAFLGWTGCDETKRYVLAAHESDLSNPWLTVPKESNGYFRAKLIEWDPVNMNAPARLVETNLTAWYGLENLLTPVEVHGNTKDCGVFFLPYDVFREGNVVYPISGHDTPAANFFEVEWDRSSYLNSGRRAKGKNYTALELSTFTWKETSFKGPYDFDAQRK